MIISKSNEPLLRAYIEREALDYQHKPKEVLEAFKERLFKTVTEYVTDKKFNFVRICSLCNVGVVERALILTPTREHFGMGKEDLMIIFGTTTTDGVSFNAVPTIRL